MSLYSIYIIYYIYIIYFISLYGVAGNLRSITESSLWSQTQMNRTTNEQTLDKPAV